MVFKDILSKSTLINQLDKIVVQNLIDTGNIKIVSYKQNSVIHCANDICNKLEIIINGRVLIESFDETGKLNTIYEFGSDNLIGCNIMFSETPYYPGTVTTQSPTVLVEIKKKQVFELLTENPSFLFVYMQNVSRNTNILFNTINLNAKKTIRNSILSFLDYESKKQNSKEIQLRTTKKALAAKIGVQRTSLSRELANMKNDGLITYDAKSITILFD